MMKVRAAFFPRYCPWPILTHDIHPEAIYRWKVVNVKVMRITKTTWDNLNVSISIIKTSDKLSKYLYIISHFSPKHMLMAFKAKA